MWRKKCDRDEKKIIKSNSLIFAIKFQRIVSKISFSWITSFKTASGWCVLEHKGQKAHEYSSNRPLQREKVYEREREREREKEKQSETHRERDS